MHGPHVRFRLPDDTEIAVPPGGLVGRLPSAAIRLMDPRISEVHALISLRGRELWLLAQRGLVQADGDRKADVRLRPGQRIALAQGIELQVVDVVLPDFLLVVVGAGRKPVELSAAVYSLVIESATQSAAPRLVPTWVRGAPLHLWADADGWWAQLAGEEEEPVSEGTTLELPGARLSVVAVPLEQAGTAATRSADRIDPPLRIVARYDTVHIEQSDRAPAVVSGLGARIITELVDYSVPVPWDMVARAVYPEIDDDLRLRTNWDRTLRRLRAMLRRKGVRDNLVRADGTGNIELLLRARDEVVFEG